jgi:cytosine/uracil/thiamine/allantoin permease
MDWIGTVGVGSVGCCWFCGLGASGGRWVVSVVFIASVSPLSLSGSDFGVYASLKNQLVWGCAVWLPVVASVCFTVVEMGA